MMIGISTNDASNNAKGFEPSFWRISVLLTLAFWISSSLMLDLVIMPGLSMAGMMTQSSFAGAGYLIFGLFNRIELLCAAVVLTGLLVVRTSRNISNQRGIFALLLGVGMLTIALTYTYALTPQMSALGLQLNQFRSITEVPALMNWLHTSYWTLDMLKLVAGGLLISLCYKDRI